MGSRHKIQASPFQSTWGCMLWCVMVPPNDSATNPYYPRTRRAIDFLHGLCMRPHASNVLGVWVMITSALHSYKRLNAGERNIHLSISGVAHYDTYALQWSGSSESSNLQEAIVRV